MDVVLSEDVAASFPYTMGVKYDILRSHEEEVSTGLFGWKKRKVKVVDSLRLISISVMTIAGDTWEIPLGSHTPENSPTSAETISNT